MALETTDNRKEYAGNGVTTGFSFPYYFLANADLKVISRNDTTGVESTKVITTDYTVSGAGNEAGGTVTMLAAPAAGTTLIIYRDPEITQGTDFRENDSLPAEATEESFDRAAMISQRLAERMNRSVRVTEGFVLGDFDLQLPADLNAVGSAGKVIIVNATEDGFEMGPTSDDISNAQQYAADADASADAADISEAIAAEWATKTNGTVTNSSEYSAKAYAIGGTGIDNTAGKGAAKDWAIKTGSTVDGTEYSAKKYATDAAASALAASLSGYRFSSTVGGTADAITLAPTDPLLAYALGVRMIFKAASNNTGAVTVNVSGLGAKAVISQTGAALTADKIVSGRIYTLTYDGTSFVAAEIENPMTAGGDLLYGGTNGILTRLPNGTLGQTLRSAGGTSAPVWSDGPQVASSKNGTYSIASTDSIIPLDCSGGSFSVTLPTAVGVTGKTYTLLRTNSTANVAVTITTTSGQTIAGIPSGNIKLDIQGECLTVYSDGANWQITNWFIPNKQYNLTVTGTSWTTFKAVGFVTKTPESVPLWRLNFNIGGTQASASSKTLTVTGVSFATGSVNDRQCVSASDDSGGSAPSNPFASGSAIQVGFAAASTAFNTSGTVQLASKPTFAM